jgi:uncharacterized membrane protein
MGNAVLFTAEIRPHRSLGRRGILLLMGGLAGASLLLGIIVALMGALPVIGFCGAEAILAILLLRLNVQRARAREFLELSAERLRIIRTDWRGHVSIRDLTPFWLRTELEERPGRMPALYLRARGISVEIGAWLIEHEKRDLAAALDKSLGSLRNPEFDNAQLR